MRQYVVCRSEMSPSFSFCHVDMLRANCQKNRHIIAKSLYKFFDNSHYGRCSLFLQDVVQLLHAPCPFSTCRPYVTLHKCVLGIWNCLASMLARLYRMRHVSSVGPYACIFPEEISRSTTFQLFRLYLVGYG